MTPETGIAVTALKAESRALSFFYGDFQALKSVTLPVTDRKITALIGPSGCGKSTFLRCFNRMHDLYPGNRYDGQIFLHPDNVDLLSAKMDPIEVRKHSRNRKSHSTARQGRAGVDFRRAMERSERPPR